MFLMQEEETPYAFFVQDKEIVDDLNTVIKDQKISTEGALKIIYQPQALFKVNIIIRHNVDIFTVITFKSGIIT